MIVRPLIGVVSRLLLIGAALLIGTPATAFHYPWDQGHDTTNWNNPEPDGPPANPNCDPCKNATSSPVYTSTGHFIWTDADVVLKGRPLLAVSRTYNSNDPRDGLFGNGWSAGLDVGLYKSTDGGQVKYIHRNADGKRYEHIQLPDGSVQPPVGRFELVLPQADGTVILQYQNGQSKLFRNDGLLAADIDRNGNRINYSYDANAHLTSISDTNGRSLTLGYNTAGRVTTITDHSGRSWSYAYDLNGSLISITNPAGGVRQYQYQNYVPVGSGFTYRQLTKITDESGVVITSITYAGSRVASYTEGANTFTYSHDPANSRVTKQDSTGSVWRHTYNADGLITEEINPINAKTTFVYDINGRETQTTDELSKVWTASYDSLGRVTSRTNPLNETTTFTYSGNNPNPVTITSPSGRVTQIAYDAKLNPTSVTDPAGAETRLEWDATGNLIATVDTLSNRTQITYNAIGQPLTVTDPLARITTYGYDNLGNQTLTQNAAGEMTHIEYDNLDRTTTVTDSLGGITSFAYDASGRLTSLTDPAGATTAYVYDQYGRRIERTAPDGRKTLFAYHNDNLLSQLTQPSNQTIVYNYDAAKRPTQENAVGQITNYTYDARGDLTQATNPGGIIARAYDDAGRLIQETNNGATIQFTHNNEGERTALFALGMTTNYSLDVRGLLTGITNSSGSYQISYDAAGRRNQLRLPNAATVDYGYDDASQLVSIDHSGPFNTTYGYTFDAAGRITRLTGDGADWDYQYDDLGRLTRADQGANSFTYTHDAVGNILNEGRVYDIANRLTEDNAHTYNYDANGNLAQKQNKTTGARTLYAWNAKNQLVSYIRYPDATSITPTKTLTFSYDAIGRRASKAEDGAVQRYVYDGEDLINVLDGAGGVMRSFTFGPGIDEPLSMTDAGDRYFHANHLGSIMALTDASAATSQYQYDPYGKTTATGEAGNPFRYTAREQDAEDLYYYRARYFDPVMKRFVSQDPMGLKEGFNLYAYVGNNPISYRDPTGLQKGSPEWCSRQAERIRNIRDKIQERIGELDENRLNLPETCPGDDLSPSLSRRGHRKLINMDKANLAAQEALYAAYCGGDDGPPPVSIPAGDSNTAMYVIGGVLLVISIAGLIVLTGGAGAAAAPALASDRRRKTAIEEVDQQTVLKQLMSIPVSAWSYTFEKNGIRHIGPMAQDFHEAFGLGDKETEIAVVDASGVLFASVQALKHELDRKTDEVRELQAKLDACLARLDILISKRQSPRLYGESSSDDGT